MKHSNEGAVCPLCEFKLKQAHPTLQEWFSFVVKPTFKDAHISWAWRGQTDQMTFFKGGDSGVPWPRSKHNKMDAQGRACAEALDLFRLLSQDKADFTPAFYRDIFNHTEKCGWTDRIKWALTKTVGGKKTRYDEDHFELICNPAGLINEG